MLGHAGVQVVHELVDVQVGVFMRVLGPHGFVEFQLLQGHEVPITNFDVNNIVSLLFLFKRSSYTGGIGKTESGVVRVVAFQFDLELRGFKTLVFLLDAGKDRLHEGKAKIYYFLSYWLLFLLILLLLFELTTVIIGGGKHLF